MEIVDFHLKNHLFRPKADPLPKLRWRIKPGRRLREQLQSQRFSRWRLSAADDSARAGEWLELGGVIYFSLKSSGA
jgi:hypothetical protein